MLLRMLLSSVVPLGLLAGAGSAGAQDVGATPPSSQSSSQAAGASSSPGAATGSPAAPSGISAPPSRMLSEVVVTAQRRSENLQRAAVAVDVVGGASLVSNGITDSQTLSFLVPGLSVNGSNYFLRGVGNFTTTPYADPAVAFNLDSVYIGRPQATLGPFFDLERVEVLKGPQGTLYGINATGGAINVIPTKPQLDHLGGYVIASYGNYGTYDFEGAVNAPIGSNTAVRLSANFLGHNGYLSDETSDQDTRAYRLQVLTKPTSNLSIRVSTDYADVGGLGQGSYLESKAVYNRATGQYGFVGSGLSSRVGLYDPASTAFLRTVAAGPSGRVFGPLAAQPFSNLKLWGVNAEINYTLPFGTLTVIPSFRPLRSSATPPYPPSWRT